MSFQKYMTKVSHHAISLTLGPSPRGRGMQSPSPSGTAGGSLRSNGEPTGVPLAGVRVGMRDGACQYLWKHQ